MKFPLPDHPFRPVELSPTQCADYERVTDALLHETLLEYERFVHVENRTLDKKLWKPVKNRENLTVYRDTQRARARVSAPHVSRDTRETIATDMHDWKLPKLLAVGSIVGSLDDVMYGVVAPDVKSMLIRSSYVNDELVDGGVLFHIKSAVEQDPFRFLGIKWLVKAHPAAINALVSPRDTVVIDATGIHTQENGDRIGYHVFHSLLLPECPELKQHSILRGLISSCYLFKQMPNGTVEVYMKTYVQPGGRLSESLAIMSVANALIGCYKSVLCAQGKKLAWLIKHNSQERAKYRKRRDADSSHECELCHSPFRAYKSARGCQSCLRLVCSRCQVSRKISHMQRGLQVKQASVVVCKDCVTNAAQLSAFDVARNEFVGKQVAQHSLMTDSHSTSDDPWTMSGITLLDEDALASTSPTTSDCGVAEVGHHARTVSLDQDLQLYNSGSWSLNSPTKSVEYSNSIPTPTSMDAGLAHQQQLLMQMNQLRIAAEQTYLITKQNESAMRFDQLD